LKVEIVLIPNKFIETPHYKLERLKHDDDRLATYRMSYTIADGPKEEDEYLQSKFAAPAVKQEAMVKGVREQSAPAPVQKPPAAVPAPAPVPVAAAAGPAASPHGIVGMILSLFRR